MLELVWTLSKTLSIVLLVVGNSETAVSKLFVGSGTITHMLFGDKPFLVNCAMFYVPRQEMYNPIIAGQYLDILNDRPTEDIKRTLEAGSPLTPHLLLGPCTLIQLALVRICSIVYCCGINDQQKEIRACPRSYSLAVSLSQPNCV